MTIDDDTGTSIEIRPLGSGDRQAWDPLWAGYLAFYEHELEPAITEATWARFHQASEPMHALGAWDTARDTDRLVGICHLVLHRSTWASECSCYLEDLYTAPDARGRGVGRALIGGAASLAQAWGADTLYWQTHTDNVVARRLYDQVARHEGFVVYQHPLG